MCEKTNSGVSEFDATKIHSVVGCVFNKGNDPMRKVIIGAPFIYDIEIKVIAISAHASHPEQGKNTLFALKCLLNKPSFGCPEDSTTFNVGLINGGSTTNTVPATLY